MGFRKHGLAVMAAALSASLIAGTQAIAGENAFHIDLTKENDGGWTYVAMANDDEVESGVNIRKSAGQSGEVVGYLYRGGAVQVLDKGEEWTEIKSGSVKGYIKNEFLTYGTEAKGLAEYYGSYGVKASWDDVKVFAGDNAGARVVATVDDGESFPVVNNNGHWLEVATGKEQTASVSAEDVTMVIMVDTAVSVKEAQEADQAAKTVSGSGASRSTSEGPVSAAAADLNTAQPAAAAETSSADATWSEDEAGSGSSQGAAPVLTAEDTSYEEAAPVEDTSYEEAAPAEDISYEEAAPAEDTSYEEAAPVEDTSYEEAEPVEDTSYEEAAPVEDTSSSDAQAQADSLYQAYLDAQAAADAAVADQSGEQAIVDTAAAAQSAYAAFVEAQNAADAQMWGDTSSDDGSSYTEDTSYDDGSSYTEDISYDDGSSYTEDTSYDDGSSYSDDSYTEPAAEEPQSSASTSDVELLAALIYCEAGNQPYEGQVAVGAVVMNRIASSSFPGSVYEVIYQSGQFTPSFSGALSSALANGSGAGYIGAAQAAMAGEDPTGGALYFNTHQGSGIKIGAHWFY